MDYTLVQDMLVIFVLMSGMYFYSRVEAEYIRGLAWITLFAWTLTALTFLVVVWSYLIPILSRRLGL